MLEITIDMGYVCVDNKDTGEGVMLRLSHIEGIVGDNMATRFCMASSEYFDVSMPFTTVKAAMTKYEKGDLN